MKSQRRRASGTQDGVSIHITSLLPGMYCADRTAFSVVWVVVRFLREGQPPFDSVRRIQIMVPNTLRMRMILNFKGNRYTQSFISYPDIKPLLRNLEVPALSPGIPYTLPAILHPAR
jgi:hypothetical protein